MKQNEYIKVALGMVEKTWPNLAEELQERNSDGSFNATIFVLAGLSLEKTETYNDPAR